MSIFKKSAIAVIVIILIACVAYLVTHQTPPQNSYKDASGLYSFNYPKEWTVASGGVTGLPAGAQIAIPGKDAAGRTNAAIVIVDVNDVLLTPLLASTKATKTTFDTV